MDDAFCEHVRACPPASLALVATENICIIRVHSQAFNWSDPELHGGNGGGSGTGFIAQLPDAAPTDAAVTHIVTAHHVVAGAVQIRVHFAKACDEFLEARLVGSNPDLDVALLAVEREELRGLKGLAIGDSDKINAGLEARACGFAQGKMHIQETRGVISGRVSMPARLQMDVAVNPGNSGGPVLDESGNVIAIVCSGQVRAQGINYGAPMAELLLSVGRILRAARDAPARPGVVHRRAVLDRCPAFNCRFVTGNPAFFRRKGAVGMVCASVNPLLLDASSDPTFRGGRRSRKGGSETGGADEPDGGLQTGDLVTAIVVDGRVYDVDAQMSIQVDFWKERVPFVALLDRLDPRQPIEWRVLRDGEERVVSVALQPNQTRFRTVHPEMEYVPYVTYGGLTAMTLTENHVRQSQHNVGLLQAVYRYKDRYASRVLLTNVRPESPFNASDSVRVGDFVEKVAFQKATGGEVRRHVTTIEQYAEAWEAARRELERAAADQDLWISVLLTDGSFGTCSLRAALKFGANRLEPPTDADETVARA